ncbi:MAG: SusC/RagA family TonB-linked outer membrane protein, partial [Chitinophagaceae bacterium]
TGYSTYLMYKIWGYRPTTGAVDIVDQLYDDEEKVGLGDARINPQISLENEIREQKRKTFNVNAFASYEIIKGLVLQVQGGMISRISTNEQFFNSKTARGYPSPNNLDGVNGSFSYSEINDLVNENTLTYKKQFSKIHALDIVAGYTMQRRQVKTYGYEVTQVPNESLGLSGMDNGVAGALNALLTENRLNSYLGRVNYNLLSRYLFTATFRADGSSKFSPAGRWGYFPSAAFAWRISKESFMEKFSFINDARIRMSYGLTGNNRIGDFSRYGSFDMAYNGYYSYNNSTPNPGIAPDDLGNAILKWETTAQADMGLSLELFKGRINFEADVYRKTTKDLLLNANLPTSSGYASVYKNIGSIRNDGLELTLSTVNVKKGKFAWSSDFNISFNRNKIIALAEGEEKILSDLSWTSTYNGQFLYMAGLGSSASSFFGYVWDGVYQYADFDKLPNGTYSLKTNVPGNGTNRAAIQPGDIKLADVNGDGVVDAKDQVVIGRGLPVHYGGFNNNFSYGPLSLNVFFQWSYGNDIYNANRIMFEGNSERRGNLNQYASYADRWSPDNQDSKNYRTNGQGLTSIYTSRVLEDGSYLRLKTVALSYSLPAAWMKKIKMQSLQLSLAAQNLYTWTNYSGMDPEVSVRDTPLTPGFDYSAYPRARTITFGLKAIF